MGLFSHKPPKKSSKKQAPSAEPKVREGITTENGHPLVMGFPAVRLLRTQDRHGVRVVVNTPEHGLAEFLISKKCVKFNGGSLGRERYDVVLVDDKYELFASVKNPTDGSVETASIGMYTSENLTKLMWNGIEAFDMRCKSPAMIMAPPDTITETYLKKPALAPGEVDKAEQAQIEAFRHALRINPNAEAPDL